MPIPHCLCDSMTRPLVLLFSLLTMAPAATLEEVMAIRDQRPTGIAVTSTGRIFVNFPYWEDPHKLSVAEVLPNKTLKPYPDAEWNNKALQGGEAAKNHYVNVQSVVVDEYDNLWVLDTGAPKMQGPVEHGPKLILIDTKQNKVKQVYAVGAKLTPPGTYLNDVRFEKQDAFAYITESGLGSFVVMNLKTGEAWRVLDGHPSTKVDPAYDLKINGKSVQDDKGNKPQFHNDSLAYDREAGIIYFKPLMGSRLYSIRAEDLRNQQLSAEEMATNVKEVGEVGGTDGFVMGHDGLLYITALSDNAIKRRNGGGDLQVIVQDKRVSWPDSIARGPDNTYYFTTSQIQTQPKWNNGKDTRNQPFYIFRIKP